MKSASALNLDLNQLDEYIVSLRQRLEQPINEKLSDYETRRAKIAGLLEVAGLLQETQAIQELSGKLGEVNECIESLRNIWKSQSGPPTAPPPAVSVAQDEVVMAPPPIEAPTPQVVADSAPAEEAEEASDPEPAVPLLSEKSETDRIAEEALRESRRRGYAGSAAMKATPNGIPQRNYEVVPANQQTGTTTGVGYGFGKTGGTR